MSKMYMNGARMYKGCKDAGSRQQLSKSALSFRGQDMAAGVILGRSILMREITSHVQQGRSNGLIPAGSLEPGLLLVRPASTN